MLEFEIFKNNLAVPVIVCSFPTFAFKNTMHVVIIVLSASRGCVTFLQVAGVVRIQVAQCLDGAACADFK